MEEGLSLVSEIKEVICAARGGGCPGYSPLALAYIGDDVTTW